jgi:hypothetical protein
MEDLSLDGFGMGYRLAFVKYWLQMMFRCAGGWLQWLGYTPPPCRTSQLKVLIALGLGPDKTVNVLKRSSLSGEKKFYGERVLPTSPAVSIVENG